MKLNSYLTTRARAASPRRRSLPLLTLGALVCALVGGLCAPSASAQQTDGGTIISNQASAAYTDGTNTYNTVSNTVTVTVANVSGLRITPDAGSNPSVVPGQTNVDYVFSVTNLGNFADQVRFLQSGASVRVTGPATITAAVIDNGDNLVGAGDVNILTNAADVTQALAKSGASGASVNVIVRLSINAAATAGQTVQVFLGDTAAGSPSFDNQPADSSANEVRTVATTSVNGLREARGDISATVQNDVQLRAVLVAPTGPVALGSNLTYGLSLCNDGNRTATATTLGGNSGVYLVAPIPVGTALSASNTFPAGTLYTTSPLSTAPQSATWTTTAPAPLSSVTRVAFNAGATLAAGACTGNFPLIVSITTTNATTPIYEIFDGFANNTIGTLVTDQSGDTVAGRGDGNANFNEPRQGIDPANTTSGNQVPTTLQQTGSVLLGPNGQPGAVGPNSTNDDYTNRSVNTGIAGVAPGGTTTAGGVVTFTNTIQNTGNANDSYTLTAPTVPAGFTVEISTDNGATYTTVSGGGNVSLAVNFGQSANVLVRVTAPTGRSVLTGFDTVIRATSGNTAATFNETIDRLYTGYVRLDKTATVTNGTGVGGATDPVPGAVIEYVITYANVMTTGGTNNVTLAATNLVITENGTAAPNNWGTTTDQLVGSASDTRGGTITGDAAASSSLTDTVASLPAGQSGVFRFRRTIK